MKDEDLAARWEEFFTDDRFRHRILELADLFPEEKSLEVEYSEVEEFDFELAEYFLHRFIAETASKIQGFTPAAMEQMLRYRWPGNVRELKNVIERAVVLTRGQYIDHGDLTLSALKTAGDTEVGMEPLSASEPTSLADMERLHILSTLQHTGWNKSRSANILGIERSTLDRKIRRYDLAELRPR